MNLNREELAWAAGFFDGEGYIGTHLPKTNNYQQLRIEVVQVRIEPLLRFQSLFGGNINGPRKNGGENTAPIYNWALGSFEKVQAIIAMLWPWLSEPKKEQAEKAFREMRKYYRILKTNQIIRGAKNISKLTKTQVDEIRSLYIKGDGRKISGNSKLLASKFKVSKRTITAIGNYQSRII